MNPFRIEKRDDGFVVLRVADDAMIAHVETRAISETNDPNLRMQQKIVKPLHQDAWKIHFTSARITPKEAEEILALAMEQD